MIKKKLYIESLRDEITRLRGEIAKQPWIQEIEGKFCEWEPITSFMHPPYAYPIKWINGRNKEIGENWKNIGVYAFATFKTRPPARFRFTNNILYIGETDGGKPFFSGRFNTVRETLDGRATPSNSKTVHGGIIRIMERYPTNHPNQLYGTNLLNELYVSLAPFGTVEEPGNKTSEEWVRVGKVRKFECDCFAAFHCIHKTMPECSER